jgi:hypothetical protein
VADYSQNWAEYRKLRNFAIAGVVLCFLGAWLGLALGRRFSHPDWWLVGVIVPFFVPAAITWTRFNRFRCPRCYQRFMRGPWTRDLMVPTCWNCGLAKYSNG